MIRNSKLRYVKKIGDLDYYFFKPSFGHWFFEDWDGYLEDKDKHSIRQKIRMLIEWIWGGVLHLLCSQRRCSPGVCVGSTWRKTDNLFTKGRRSSWAVLYIKGLARPRNHAENSQCCAT